MAMHLPYNLRVVATGTEVLNLTWHSVEAPDENYPDILDYYTINYGYDSGNVNILLGTTTNTFIQQAGLEISTLVYYEVRAVSTIATVSDPASESCATWDNVKGYIEADFIYILDIEGAVVTGYIGAGGYIAIQVDLGGHTPYAIGIEAFAENLTIEGMTPSNGTVLLGSGVCRGCSALTLTDLPPAVASLGENCFKDCILLTFFINTQSGITDIGDSCFAGCSALPSIELGASVASIGDYAFDGDSLLTSIVFDGLVAPSVGTNWILNTNAGLRGHAYAASNFPTPGNSFNGLTMGSTLGDVPGICTGTTITVNVKAFTFAWVAPASDGGSAITGYNVYTGTTIGSISLQANIASTNYTLSGLPDRYTLYWYVKAVNAIGEGAATPTGSGTTPTVPGVPTGLVTASGVGSINIIWSAPVSNGGSAITQYNIYVGSVVIGTRLVGTRNYTQTGLTPGQVVTYNISATNAVGEGAKSASASNNAWHVPGVATLFSETDGDSQVTLSWGGVTSDSPVTGYQIYRAGSQAGTYALAQTATSTPKTDAGLTIGQTYWYKIRAISAVGTGSFTSAISGCPQANTELPMNASLTNGDALNVYVYTLTESSAWSISIPQNRQVFGISAKFSSNVNGNIKSGLNIVIDKVNYTITVYDDTSIATDQYDVTAYVYTH